MIKVKLHNINVTGVEKHIAKALSQSIKDEVEGLHCDYCTTDSQVILHVDNSRMSVLRTEIRPCCSAFFQKIEEALYEEVKV